MKAILSPNPYRDRGLRLAQKAQEILRNGGVDTALCLPFAVDPSSKLDMPKHLKYCDMETELNHADLLVCFGGDGTILHAARDTHSRNIPVLGVNMGSVGFMAELEHNELHRLEVVTRGAYTVETRMMIDIAVYHGNELLHQDVALNDAVITKGAVARVIDLDVRGNGTPIYQFSGDGVVLATPTGSTAYSLSAGGPIVEPSANNILVTPICAHSLSTKPLVMGQERIVSVEIPRQSRKTAYLSVDGGRAIKLSGGDRVEVKRSKELTRLVRLDTHNFYGTMNKKLGRA